MTKKKPKGVDYNLLNKWIAGDIHLYRRVKFIEENLRLVTLGMFIYAMTLLMIVFYVLMRN